MPSPAPGNEHSRFTATWPTDELLTRRLSDVEAAAIRWLWDGRIARARLSLLIGHPGEGKSWAAMAVAAALSLGAALPGETARREPCDVLLASAEDDPADTLRPRFDALGGDPERLMVVDGVRTDEGERGLALPGDIEVLDAELRVAELADRPYSLLIIDPLSAYLPGDLDSHRDVSVRSALAPLARLAEQHGVAILAVSHLTKGSRDTPMLRAQGSIAFTAAARTVLALGRDPQDPDGSPVRHLLMVKSNLGPLAPGLKFTLEGGHFGWLGASDLTGHALMAARGDAEDGGALVEAQGILRQILADGDVEAKAALSQCRDAGVSEATARRARQALGVEARKQGFGPGGHWLWSLPPKALNAPPTEADLRSDPAKTPIGALVHEHERLSTDEQLDPLPVEALLSGPEGAAKALNENLSLRSDSTKALKRASSPAPARERQTPPTENGHVSPAVAAALRAFPDARVVETTPSHAPAQPPAQAPAARVLAHAMTAPAPAGSGADELPWPAESTWQGDDEPSEPPGPEEDDLPVELLFPPTRPGARHA